MSNEYFELSLYLSFLKKRRHQQTGCFTEDPTLDNHLNQIVLILLREI